MTLMLKVMSQASREMRRMAERACCLRHMSDGRHTLVSNMPSWQECWTERTRVVGTGGRHAVDDPVAAVANECELLVVAGPAVVEESVKGERKVRGGEDDEVEIAE